MPPTTCVCKTVCVLHEVWATHPPVGVYIGILGFLGVLVALTRDPTKIGSREKAVWLFVMFTLLLLEIKSVYQDRNEHDEQQAEARQRENDSFQTIADGINRTIITSEQQFEATTADMKQLMHSASYIALTAKQSLDQITGNHQFCYLSSERLGNGQIGFLVMNSGPLPLERCYVVIFDNPSSIPKTPEEREKLFVPLVARELGPVLPGPNQMMGTAIVLPCCSYRISIFTRNDRFLETLTVNPDYPTNSRSFENTTVMDDKGRKVHVYP
jgi:hypothetical protein